MRFCEEAGISFQVPDSRWGKSAKGTLARISKSSSYWALATTVRIGDTEACDPIFNRESLYKLDVTAVDNLIEKYLKIMEKSREDLPVETGFNIKNFGILLARIIPEILSRLCCKCSLEAKSRLLNFLLEVYKSDQKGKYRGIDNLTKRLLQSFSDHQQLQIVPTLLMFPLFGELDFIANAEFKNPFIFLNTDRILRNVRDTLELDEDRVLHLLEQGQSHDKVKRGWATYILSEVYHLGLLNKLQENKLGEVLWAQCDSFGFPTHTDYLKSEFFKLPKPAEINVGSLFKKYVQETPFPIQEKTGRLQISLSSGDIPICKEIIGASEIIQWTEQEILFIFDRLVEWWDADKEYLTSEALDFALPGPLEEFRSRFAHFVPILSEVIAPAMNEQVGQHVKDIVSRILAELPAFGLSALRARVAFTHVFPSTKKEVIAEVEDALASSKSELIIEALAGALWMIRRQPNDPFLAGLLDLLGQLVRFQRQTELSAVINVVNQSIKRQRPLFSGHYEELILKGLKNIAEDTDLTVGDASLDIFEKLKIRRAAANLAYEIFRVYLEEKRPIPDSIKVWESICQSEKEFAEIRNQWSFA